ncbi:MAG TPA: hypothetical protein VF230_16640 [Acidimicrobiales bacterium]
MNLEDNNAPETKTILEQGDELLRTSRDVLAELDERLGGPPGTIDLTDSE